LVTIYEQEDYVGGRSTVVWPWEQDPYLPPRPRTDEEEEEEEPVELGASIFVEANKNLQKAVKEFGLETTQYGQGEQQDGGETGVWDGERFVFKQSRFGWWDKTKLFFRYGRSPFKVKKLVESTLNSFVSLYSRLFITSPNFPFDSYLNLSIALELLPSASQTGSEYFKDRSISPLFTNELVSSATQVNYGQSIEEIHGLGALVSLAAQGAVSVKGGNRKIFEEFVVRSEANLRLGTKVKEIVKLDDGSESSSSSSSTRSKWIVKTQDGQNSGVYDAIILAAPFHESFISIPQLASQSIPPRQPYVDLHVTLILTNASSPLSSHFSLSPKSKTPNSIFSTFTTSSTSKPKFNSLNYLKLLGPKLSAKFDPHNAEITVAKVHVVKIFSKNELTEIELQGMFGLKNVLKVFKKQWKSYPYLEPIQQQTSLAQIRLDEKGIYYVNGMERLISTMETEVSVK
jgi:prenylcysteine oxidase/farnesylcysteine lyase